MILSDEMIGGLGDTWREGVMLDVEALIVALW